jgi:uncharacterized protein with PQ loop repeat
MSTAQMIGAAATLYGFGASLTILLQARQLRERGTSCDVSARFLGTYVGGYAIWLLYGLTIESVPIVVVHAVGLACGALTLGVASALRGSLPAGSVRARPRVNEQPRRRGRLASA